VLIPVPTAVPPIEEDEDEGDAGAIAAENLERLKVDFNGQTIRVSCSFGVASRGEAVSLDTLLMRADEALYRAKHEGRNRVVAVGAGAT